MPAAEPGPAAVTAGPLAGRRILLPRARPDDAIAAELAAAGAEVVCVGVTRAVAGAAGPRERAAADLAAGHYAWVVLTSARTFEFFDFSALSSHEGAAARARGTKIAAVGAGTAHAVREQLGREPDLVAAGSGTALLELPQLSGGPDHAGTTVAPAPPGPAATRPTPGAARVGTLGIDTAGRLLLPGSALASPKLAAGLAAAGWDVDAVAAYTMEPAPAADLPEGLVERWTGGGFDVVVLVAGSSTRALIGLAGPPPPATRVVAIGRPTAAAAATAELRVDAVAASPTPAAIRDAILTALPTDLRR